MRSPRSSGSDGLHVFTLAASGCEGWDANMLNRCHDVSVLEACTMDPAAGEPDF